MLSRRMAKLAADLPLDFCATAEGKQVLYSYVWPCTSQHVPDKEQTLQQRLGRSGKAQLGAIAEFVTAHFQWTPQTLVQRFERILFPGILLQELRETAQTPDGAETRPSGSPVSQITDFFSRVKAHSPKQARQTSRLLQVHSTRAMSLGTEVRVSYETKTYRDQLPDVEPASNVLRVWVPESLLLAGGTHEQALYRAYRVQQQRKLQTSPTKKARSADQPLLTAFFSSEKAATRPTDDRGKEQNKGRDSAAELRAYSDGSKQASVDVFGSVTMPPGKRAFAGRLNTGTGAAKAHSHAPSSALSKESSEAPTISADVPQTAPLVPAPLVPSTRSLERNETPKTRPLTDRLRPKHPTYNESTEPAVAARADTTPDTSVEFVGMHPADLSAETSTSSMESPRTLLLRVCRPNYVQ